MPPSRITTRCLARVNKSVGMVINLRNNGVASVYLPAAIVFKIDRKGRSNATSPFADVLI